MNTAFSRILSAAALAAGLALTAPAMAQISDQVDTTAATDAAAQEAAEATPALIEPGNQVNPTALSVHEDTLMEALGPDQQVVGRITIPNESAAGLIKPANKGWAGLNSGLLEIVTIGILVVTLLGLLGFYLYRGRIRVEKGLSGVRITRFTGIERFAHWLTAISFITLALTGLNVVIGRSVLLPLVGEGAFGAITQTGKLMHNYIGWAFMAGLVLIFVMWVGRNIPRKRDLEWIKQAGGIFQKGVHPPAGKFNAGQKIIFWSVVLGGAALAFTGVMMLFPGQTSGAGQWHLFQLVHGFAAAIMAAIVLAHIYIGSVGMEGAFDDMGQGEVDVNWAKQHHALWVDKVMMTKGKGSATPAE